MVAPASSTMPGRITSSTPTRQKFSGPGLICLMRLTSIAAGLIYLVLPLDLVPDFIPGIGYIDDALVLSTLWKILESQIDSYMAFRVERLSEP